MIDERITINNKKLNLVTLKQEDVAQIYTLLQNLSEEATKYSMSPYKLEWVKLWLSTPALIHITAKKDEHAVGFICIEEWTHPRRKHTGYLGAYIHKNYEDTGLLAILLQRILAQAEEKHIHKVDVEIVSERTTTIYTLEKHGFQIEGTKRDTFYDIENQYHDTILMGKIL